jgi:hypothetical protein
VVVTVNICDVAKALSKAICKSQFAGFGRKLRELL